MNEIVYSPDGWRFRLRLERGGAESHKILETLMAEQPEIFSEKYDTPPKDPTESVFVAREYTPGQPFDGIVYSRSTTITRQEVEQRVGDRDRQYMGLKRAFETAVRFNKQQHPRDMMVVIEHGRGDERWYDVTTVQAGNYGWRRTKKGNDD